MAPHSALAVCNDQYLLAVRKRLGLLPDAALLHELCTACHGRNVELPQLRCDPHHSEACLQQTAASVTARPNLLVKVLA